MGVRSDVAIAMKEYVYENLSPKAKKFLEEWGFEERSSHTPSGEKDVDDAGRVLVTQDVKWYWHDYDDIIAFIKHLSDDHDEEDWLIIQACHDYPGDEEGNAGEWYENPFNLHKQTSVELSWD